MASSYWGVFCQLFVLLFEKPEICKPLKDNLCLHVQISYPFFLSVSSFNSPKHAGEVNWRYRMLTLKAEGPLHLYCDELSNVCKHVLNTTK